MLHNLTSPRMSLSFGQLLTARKPRPWQARLGSHKAIMALESVFLRTGILLTLPHVRQSGIAMVDAGCAGANCVMAARNSPWAVR
jgi:hypothetical protein